jgi:D-tyrosyl-tRNA(Tyr) deacylase
MRAVVQRVSYGRVTVSGDTVGEIGPGLVVLLGVEVGDTERDAEYMADKICNLRIFEDDGGKMNLSVLDTGGGMLVVSQFTLLGDCRKGRRPSFTGAAEPGEADRLYKYFNRQCTEKGIKVETGVFQAHMKVELENDGPVTLLVDSKKTF